LFGEVKYVDYALSAHVLKKEEKCNMETTGKYQVEESIENALEMIGSHPTVIVEPPRKSVVRRQGKMIEEEEPSWVKFSTGFKKELVELGEHALKVFLYIGLSIGFESGSSHPGFRKIAKDTGMAQNTAIKAVQELEEKGFLVVNRREKASNVYTPIRYISIGKSASPDEADEPEPPQNSDNLPHENDNLPHDSRVNYAQLEEQDKPELTSEEIEQANRKVDAILRLNRQSAFQWKGRDYFKDNLLVYADWYFEKTGQICTKKYSKSWIKAFSEWREGSLDLKHLESARLARLKWKDFIADPNELTKDALAIKAQENLVPAQVQQGSSGFYA
jgi:DNA-binding MarR family transcriptional regulator